MTFDDAPTPQELRKDPELAILFALEATLWAARALVISVHPDLQEPSPLEPEFGSTWTALRLILAIDLVRQRLDDHASAVRRERRHKEDEEADSLDWSF